MQNADTETSPRNDCSTYLSVRQIASASRELLRATRTAPHLPPSTLHRSPFTLAPRSACDGRHKLARSRAVISTDGPSTCADGSGCPSAYHWPFERDTQLSSIRRPPITLLGPLILEPGTR